MYLRLWAMTPLGVSMSMWVDDLFKWQRGIQRQLGRLASRLTKREAGSLVIQTLVTEPVVIVVREGVMEITGPEDSGMVCAIQEATAKDNKVITIGVPLAVKGMAQMWVPVLLETLFAEVEDTEESLNEFLGYLDVLYGEPGDGGDGEDEPGEDGEDEDEAGDGDLVSRQDEGAEDLGDEDLGDEDLGDDEGGEV